jgi:thiol:disulfide interchange protein
VGAGAPPVGRMENSLLYYTGVAFLGGVILNVMPCVLPVLTMKVFHIMEKAKEDPAANRKHGIAYGAGILVMFWVFGAIVIALRAMGDNVGWGMQFQNPGFVAAMTGLMVVFGLNALGVFEINVGMGGVETGGGYWGSFVNGIIASIMSTPCSAPFLGTAATYALGSGAVWWQTQLMFTFIGLGLAAPFALVSFVPAVSRILPKPGAWMDTFKQLMGFTLLGAAAWLYGALTAQVTREAAQSFLYFLIVLSIALWAIQKLGGIEHSSRRRWIVHVGALGLTALAGWQLLGFERIQKQTVATAEPTTDGKDPPIVVDGKIAWVAFDPGVIEQNRKRGRPVFVDFTAEWCANCKANERLFIETDTIRGDLTRTNILAMKADFTSQDEVIEEHIEKLGREAVPIYVIFYPDGTHDLLPEVISTKMLSEALSRASERFPSDKYAPPTATPTKTASSPASEGERQASAQ